MTSLMAIVNVTRNSFSGDGLLSAAAWQKRLLAKVDEAVVAGATWVDVGAESTRPGADRVPEADEYALVEEAIELILAHAPVAVSVDTTRASVADRACELGAAMINDVSALAFDPEIADVAAARNVDLVLMHNWSESARVEVHARLGKRFVPPLAPTEDIIATINGELVGPIAIAIDRGVERDTIWLDPGIGFGKTQEQNLEIVARADELAEPGHRLLVGPSRKSFIGWALDLPPEERVEGTAAVVALLTERGVDLVRVHDPREMARIVAMVSAVLSVRPGH